MTQLKVEFQEGKYRVTLSDIKLRLRKTDKKGQEGDLAPLTKYVYDGKKSEWLNSFESKGTAKIINTTLLKKFEIGHKYGGQDF